MPGLLDVTLTCAGTSWKAMSGSIDEAISAPTRATVTVLATAELDEESLLSKPAVLEAFLDGTSVRKWHLVVISTRMVSVRPTVVVYEMTLAHELALLSYRFDCRIFQEKDAKDIVTSVLTGAGVEGGHVSWAVNRTLSKRKYTVQHRESDLSFASRLLEYEGVFYFPDDSGSDAKVVIADGSAAFTPIDGDPNVPVVRSERDSGVSEFWMEYASTPDQVSMNDWSFEQPNMDLAADGTIDSTVRAALYEFPSGVQTNALARTIADIRRDEILAQRKVAQGKSDDIRFRAGSHFALTEVARDPLATSYLLRRVLHRFNVATFGRPKRGPVYTNAFVASPLDAPFRPRRVTPVPRVYGSESVAVTGPSGQEIYTDSLGRMKGRFYWDRGTSDDATASTWMRVLQHPIGMSMALARVGWEMTVRFSYGDPDRPVALCRVDDGDHKSPYGYPAAASSMSFKTLTSPGGGKHNEVSMEDGAGGMKFAVNAAKDFTEQVINNKTETIAVDEKLNVGVTCSTTIGANQTLTIGANHTKIIGAESMVTITGDRTVTIGAAETCTVTGSVGSKIKGSDTESVGATHLTAAALGVSRTSKGSASLTVGAAMVSAGGMGCAISVAGSRSETVGAVKMVASGNTVVESIVGAGAITVGGVVLNVAGANRLGNAKGDNALTVGGVVLANAAGKLQWKAKTVSITVVGMANLIGGGGVINMTPGSVAFVGLVTVKASGSVKISGAPNLMG